MKKKKKEFLIISIITILFIVVLITSAINSELKKKNVKILFKDQEISGTNVAPGECVFILDGQKYLLSINTKYLLKYVDMDTLKTKHKIPAEKYVWYRVHGPVTREEAEDPIQIEFSKIEKSSDSCDQRIATIVQL